MLTRLGHGTVRRSDDEDRAVHLGSARDHVLDVVRVTGAVNVRIVTLVRLILDVRGIDCNSACFLFGRLVDFVVAHLLSLTFARHNHGDSCGQRRLAVVNVANGTNVDVGLASVKFCHFGFPPKIFII